MYIYACVYIDTNCNNYGITYTKFRNFVGVNLIGISWFWCWVRLQNEVVLIPTTHYITKWIVNAGQFRQYSVGTDRNGSPSSWEMGMGRVGQKVGPQALEHSVFNDAVSQRWDGGRAHVGTGKGRDWEIRTSNPRTVTVPPLSWYGVPSTIVIGVNWCCWMEPQPPTLHQAFPR